MATDTGCVTTALIRAVTEPAGTNVYGYIPRGIVAVSGLLAGKEQVYCVPGVHVPAA